VFTTYEVKCGDTLQKIAHEHDITVNELRVINPDNDPIFETALSILDWEWRCVPFHSPSSQSPKANEQENEPRVLLSMSSLLLIGRSRGVGP
jgi:hypothetical protein